MKYIWSLDISTTNIGSALWSETGELIELNHLKLVLDKNVTVSERDIRKANIFKKYAVDFKKRVEEEFKGEIGHIIVEEPLGGSNNANTVALLHGFNGMCRYILYEVFNHPPLKISVYDSRKLFCPELITLKKEKGVIKETLSFPPEYRKDKKVYIWEKVQKLHPNIKWYYKKNGDIHEDSYDMSDSYCVGYAGLKVLNIIK